MSDIPLKEYFENLMNERDKRYSNRFAAQEEAIKVARAEAIMKNTELNDVRHRFVSREVFDAYVKEQQNKARATIALFITLGLAIVGLVLKILG
jgi:predicted nucleic acid-binding Zn ribbon protein